MRRAVPPLFNPEAERTVLGISLLEPENFSRVVKVLRPEEFYREGHRKIFEAMIGLFNRHDPVDLITVSDELRKEGRLNEVGGAQALAALVEESATSAHLLAYANIVRENAQKRELLDLGNRLTAGAQNGQPTTELLEIAQQALANLHVTGTGISVWPLYDGADEWEFPAVAELVDKLLPAKGIGWLGGLPKRYKSLFALYLCLAIACRRPSIAKAFSIKDFPRILYVAREDGGSRLQDRKADILKSWAERPEPGAIRFVIQPHLDLLNVGHIRWLRETCHREGVGFIVLDTWTALSPSADPLGAKDQAQLAAIVRQLSEDIGGLVLVVDHCRKNRPEGLPLSSAEIFGPPQKWAAAEHILMLDTTADGRRLELFIESKDLETRRLQLTVSPPGSGEEKFSFAGSVDELADAQRAIGDRNREAILGVLQTTDGSLAAGEIMSPLQSKGIRLNSDTIQKHLRGLIRGKRARMTGRGRAARYFALNFSPEGPSSGKAGDQE